jgi:predicted PurR-regulated permease PerM
LVAASPPPERPSLTPVPDDRPPEPLAVVTDAEAEMPLPSNPQTFFLGGIFALSVFATLYLASPIILPVVLAFVLKLLLQPAVRLLQRVHLPRPVGALLTVLLAWHARGCCRRLVSASGGLGDEVARGHTSLGSAPRSSKKSHPGVAKGHSTGRGSRGQSCTEGSTIAVRPDLGLSGALFTGTREVLGGLFTTVLVLYFLLVAGDIFLRRAVEILPTFSNKRQAVDISQQVEEDISASLVTITAMNAAVGVATAVAMYLCGLGDPLLWGAAAFLLNYIPILGPLLGIVIFLLAGMLSFDSLWWALLPPALYFGIHLLEGETLTPMLLARRFTLNPVLVILSLVFWFWMWGVPGAILAVPLLAFLKIICDRLRPLKALGHFLEGE